MDIKNKVKKPHVSYNSGNNEWYTPKYIIDAARKTMGSIDLDPASSDIANKIVKATSYYTKDDDGLSQQWFGNIWLNPPYSRDLIRKFADAVINKRKDFDQAIILVNNATETGWFQRVSTVTSVQCFVAKRIRFLDKNGKLGKPLQGQVILYVGSYFLKFIEYFSQFGDCRIKCDLKSVLNTVSDGYIENIREQFLLNIKNQGYYALGRRNWKIRKEQDFISIGEMFTNNYKYHMLYTVL